jgi:hypothetical protein
MTNKDKKWLESLLENLPKRPKTVLEMLLKKGEVSTYELGQLGYDQPPRAAQDLKEAGVKLVTKNGKHPVTGARMGIYTLADDQSNYVASGGRIAFPKAFRKELEERDKNRCVLCETEYSPRFLQIDHKIPFIVGGDDSQLNADEFQLLCGSHQRMKSWECEHCPNRVQKDEAICASCYWASPENYTHVATKHHKVVPLTLVLEEEIAVYNTIKGRAEEQGLSAGEYIKKLMSDSVKE